jgi:hypothetical protein
LLGEGEKKELVQTYMSQRLTRDKALSICKISKNQFYPYTPQENGQVESFHAILGRDLQGKSFDNIESLEHSLKEFYDFYNFERIHGSTLQLPPITFWHQWELGNVPREIIDAKKRKVKFSLRNVQKIK